MTAKSIAIFTILAALGSIAMSTTFVGTSFADKGVVPDDSALSRKACENANNRNNKHHKLIIDQEHESYNHNYKGIEYSYC